jgi:hypothetical protein
MVRLKTPIYCVLYQWTWCGGKFQLKYGGMDNQQLQELFEEKYEKVLGLSYQDWLQQGPQNQDEAFQRCIAIDKELDATYEKWFEATGEEKERLETYRDKLKAEYDFLEESFHLEERDRHW